MRSSGRSSRSEFCEKKDGRQSEKSERTRTDRLTSKRKPFDLRTASLDPSSPAGSRPSHTIHRRTLQSSNLQRYRWEYPRSPSLEGSPVADDRRKKLSVSLLEGKGERDVTQDSRCARFLFLLLHQEPPRWKLHRVFEPVERNH